MSFVFALINNWFFVKCYRRADNRIIMTIGASPSHSDMHSGVVMGQV